MDYRTPDFPATSGPTSSINPATSGTPSQRSLFDPDPTSQPLRCPVCAGSSPGLIGNLRPIVSRGSLKSGKLDLAFTFTPYCHTDAPLSVSITIEPDTSGGILTDTVAADLMRSILTWVERGTVLST